MIERRLRIAALCIVAGLFVEMITLFSARPTAFLVFIGLGGLLIAAGIVLYLWTLLRSLVPRSPDQMLGKESI